MATHSTRRFTQFADLTGRARSQRVRVQDLARLLDSAVRIPGTEIRVGLDALLGLVPGVGDAIAGGMGALIVHTAWRQGLPKRHLARMAGNLAVDTLVGSIPVLGSIFDVFFRANQRNLRILEEHLAKRGR